ncbi:hypothetical protein GCM10011609_27580 [Lentzea pudingi]|uniref:CHAT domain-containing protein n=1 Tax=Lentzea pudingi TaxID=1789439 RepID=A0ABQ2HUA4_9PSEU|nr:CHAT domain-containing tetratricopeptide repeat protein [Lentzea pudingi]GGM89218.1 hypothetical protein GCM10011609_27580 [Lentzea pudingi]
MAEENGIAEIVARCDAVTRGATHTSVSAGELTAFTADVARLPEENPDRSRLAVTMLTTVTRGGGPAQITLIPHLDDLLRLVGRVPASMIGWAHVVGSVRAQHLAHLVASGEYVDLAAARHELAGHAEAAKGAKVTTMLVEAAQAAVTMATDGSNASSSEMTRVFDDMFAQIGDHPIAPTMHKYSDAMGRLLDAAKKSDVNMAASAFRELRGLVDTLLPEFRSQMNLDDAQRSLEEVLGVFEPAQAEQDERSAGDFLKNAGPSPNAQLRARVFAAVTLFQRGEETDVGRVNEALDHIREAITFDQGDDLGLFALTGLAAGLLRRSELIGSVAGLDEAEEVLHKALARMRDASHPQWSLTHEMLAAIRHRQGDFAGAGPFSLAAQRAYVWRVLLESDPAEAKWAIRDAVGAAMDTAMRCLSAGSVSDALRALDTGRGLLLFAEAELRALPARLTAAGHPDLAERWVSEGRDSQGLRKQVMTTLLADGSMASTLLDPPSLGEIRSALASSDADALVYLVPGKHPGPGYMVIAPKAGPPAYLMLPNLHVGKGTEVDQYLAALTDRARNVKPVGGTRASFAEQVDSLCDWAWRSAIGPMLESYFAEFPPGSTPAVVLVPMGDLARIPWQAARRQDGRYAIELASFSQAVSARLFCENAKRSPIGPTSTGLVVGDPDTRSDAPSLASARAEAQAVRRVFYPGARYLGRRADGSQSPSGRGTTTEIREWLADAAPYAGTTLHLACHGLFAPTEDGGRAELQLAPDDPDGPGPGQLDADEIIRILEAVPERRIGLVVMGACHTGRSIHGYDEAYSLGTAFLAAGARTVLSTHWAIPDAETSALMFLFHHHLLTEGLPSREALRAAQLWMLSPDPVVPARMPADLVSLAADRTAVVAWAGFTHAGH